MKVRVRAYPHEVYDVLEESPNFYVVPGPSLVNKSFCEVLPATPLESELLEGIVERTVTE